jgi:hypothetical protein
MGVFSKSFQGFTSYIDPLGAFLGRESGVSDYLVKKNAAAPPAMPDQNSVLQASQLQESKDAALQYGRAATVLTGTGATGQATTGDKLGP